MIRVHRAAVAQYRDRKQLTANMCFNSSWALFPPLSAVSPKGGKPLGRAEEFTPREFYGRSCALERDDHRVIRGLRKWSQGAFESKRVLSAQFITTLADVPTQGVPSEEAPSRYTDFDLQVKIVQLVPLD